MSAPTARTILGLEAEALVATDLEKSGYRILDRNWRKPWGELDVVATKGEVVHFVEVKASKTNIAGFEPFLRADARKMHKVKRTAMTWLSDHRYGPDTEWQLDIASVVMGESPEIEYFQNV